MKPTQLDVRYHLMKGRIHATLSEGMESDDVSVMSSGKRGVSVLRGVKVGDTLNARVVRVKERQIEGYVCWWSINILTKLFIYFALSLPIA